MTTKKLYLEDQDCFELSTMVRHTGRDDRGFWVELYETIMHPQGGGQRSDRGTVNDLQVVHVAHGRAGRVLHYLDPSATELPQEYDDARVVVDAAERNRNAAYHTAGHLVAALVEATHPTLRACGGHHWPRESRVEFVRPQDDPGLDALETELNSGLANSIRANLPVLVEGDPHRSRTVRIGDFEAVPCGGTHVFHLGVLSRVTAKKARFKSGKLRISYEVS